MSSPPQGPSISVVVPTYDRRDYLPETLRAILGQSRPPGEVIVVDDGSRDGTAEMLAASFPSVRVIAIANSGDLAARNVGTRAARGEVVVYCDSDDLWMADHLGRMAALWQAEPSLTAAYANFRLLREGGLERGDKFADAPEAWFEGLEGLGPGLGVLRAPLVARLIRFTPLFPSCMAVARERFLRGGGWDESVGRTVGTDFATMLRIAETPPIGLVLEPTVAIRKHAANYSGDVQKMNLGDAVILESLLARRPSLSPLAGEIRASVRHRRIMALEIAFSRLDFAGVRQIRALLGDAVLPPQIAAKCAVAALPPAVATLVAKPLLALGSMRAAAWARRGAAEASAAGPARK